MDSAVQSAPPAPIAGTPQPASSITRIRRDGPKLMQSRNPQLPTNIDEADLSAIPTLVELGQ
jgi:hypothetical protein